MKTKWVRRTSSFSPEPPRPARAKDTAELAADLGGEAERPAGAGRDQDRLYECAVSQPEEKFFGPVSGPELFGEFGSTQTEMVLEPLSQAPRKVGHGSECLCSFFVNPFEDLLSSIGWLCPALELAFELFQGQILKVHFAHR